MLAEIERLKVRELVAEGLEVDESSRAEWMRRACRDLSDAARSEVQSLIAAGLSAAGFLRNPTVHPGVSPEASAWETLSGQMIGPYRLVRELGRGGFGTVWLGEQESPIRREVAVKLINPGMDTRNVLARFEAEKQALALMDHVAIARVLDGGTTPSGRPYFVMELVDGQPITDFCRDRCMSLKQRLELLISVCRAVQHAHQKGIIHRDIKPGNVLVSMKDGKPSPKVIDFGVAKALHGPLADLGLQTAPRQMVGTPLYMSPEQTDEGSGEVDTRTDVYGLGVTLYELLTDEPPFDELWRQSRSIASLQQAIRDVEPAPPSRRRSGRAARMANAPGRDDTIDVELDWIVLRAIAKEPARRYSTADALADDLERYLTHQPVHAAAPTWRYRARKMMRRHRAAFAVAAALTFVLLAGLTGTLWGFFTASSQRDAAIRAQTEEASQRVRAEMALASEAVAKSAAQASETKLRREYLRLGDVHTYLLEMMLTGQRTAEGIPAPAPPRETLDFLSRRLAETPPRDPWVGASIYGSLAEGYDRQTDYAASIRHYRLAIEQIKRLDPPQPLLLETSYHGVGRGFFRLRDFATAEQAYTEALSVSATLSLTGRQRLRPILTMSMLAQTCLAQNKHEPAADWIGKMLDTFPPDNSASPDEIDEQLRGLDLIVQQLETRRPDLTDPLRKRWSNLTLRHAADRGVAQVPLPRKTQTVTPEPIAMQLAGMTPQRESLLRWIT